MDIDLNFTLLDGRARIPISSPITKSIHPNHKLKIPKQTKKQTSRLTNSEKIHETLRT